MRKSKRESEFTSCESQSFRSLLDHLETFSGAVERVEANDSERQRTTATVI